MSVSKFRFLIIFTHNRFEFSEPSLVSALGYANTVNVFLWLKCSLSITGCKMKTIGVCALLMFLSSSRVGTSQVDDTETTPRPITSPPLNHSELKIVNLSPTVHTPRDRSPRPHTKPWSPITEILLKTYRRHVKRSRLLDDEEEEDTSDLIQAPTTLPIEQNDGKK